MSSLDVEAIRMEIARRHNVLIGKDDPILVTLTMNELVLGHYLALVRDAAGQAEALGAERMAQEIAAVKGAAETLVGGAARYAGDAIEKAASQAVAAIGQELERQRGKLSAHRQPSAAGTSSSVVLVGVICFAAGLVAGALAL